MALNDFLTAVAAASQKYASQYGLTPKELQLALITTAGLEGGLGETPGVGDGGLSHGRFQFHTGGGHGTTLLNQGWTIEDFYDDAKVVDHWAPLLAQSIANAKRQGYTGGEAIRQGAYALERPAQIYPSERFNTVIEQAAGLIGEVPPPSGGGSSIDAQLAGGEVDTIRRGLQQRALELWETFQTTQSPEDYAAFQGALFDIQVFEDAMPGGSGNDAAQQAFENAIELGDFEGKEADRLYNRWRDKATLARTAAEGEISLRSDHNERNVALQEARNQSMTPGLLPRPTDAGYIAPDYERILNRWNERFGVGSEPPATFDSGIGLPGAATPGASAPASAPGAMRDFAQGAIGGIDFKTPRMPEPEEYPSGWGKVPFGKVAYNFAKGWQGEEVPGSRQLDERATWLLGRGWGAASKGVNAGLEATASAYSTGKKKAKKWWNDLTNPATYRFGIPGYDNGVLDHPGGPALLNERGPETIIGPDGNPQQVAGAAQVMNLPQGAAVLPAGIPANEAFYFAQIKRGLAQGGGNPEVSPQAQMARANDPQLRQKVMESLRRAVAAEDAANPPFTPILGPGIAKDYWRDWRPLTGVPAAAPVEQPTKGGPR